MDKTDISESHLLNADKTLLEAFDFDEVELKVRHSTANRNRTRNNKWSRLTLSSQKVQNQSSSASSTHTVVAEVHPIPPNKNTKQAVVQKSNNSVGTESQKKSATTDELDGVDLFHIFCVDPNNSMLSFENPINENSKPTNSISEREKRQLLPGKDLNSCFKSPLTSTENCITVKENYNDRVKKWEAIFFPGDPPKLKSPEATNLTFESPILFSSSSDSDRNQNSNNLLKFNQSKQISPQVIQRNSENQFSQLFKSTQAIKQLDEAILRGQQQLGLKSEPIETDSQSNNQQNNFKVPFNKRKTAESPQPHRKILKTESPIKEELNTTPQLESSQYRNQVSQLFKKVEESIYQGTPKPSNSNQKQTTDWGDDSFMTEALVNGLTQNVNHSFNSMIKNALKENVNKSVEPKLLSNRTIINGLAVFKHLGPFYGLPEKVLELIKLYKGIEKLYDWQDECLNLPAVKDRKNLIYSLPTSGGKTLVAEVLLLREIICRKRNVIFVLPYVAIVQEKVWALSPFAVALNFLVEEYAAGKGIYPPKTRRYKNSVFVATTEKALGLVNSLVEQGRLEELGLIVVDELHLIGDEQRGPKLEALLTKLMYLNEDIQIVGMSATIGNLEDIQQFLKAEVYTRNFRPVELTEHVKCGKQIAKVNSKAGPDNILELYRQVDFSYSEQVNKIDPDHLGGLVMEVVPKGSCLIFCSSKKSAENVTKLLCKIMMPKLKQYKEKEKIQLLRALEFESGTLCEILKMSVPFGFAYHHSGLTSEERKLIEEAYRAGVLCLICCTSTLAAGVNLPAKRVIIRKPFIATEFISLSRYKQMVGRAGRAGFGETGESILICDKKELPKVKELLVSPMDQTLSRMHDNECSSLRNLFLSCISLGTANTKTQLEKVAEKTLLAVQRTKLDIDIKKLIRKAITDLFVLGAIKTFKQSQGEAQNPTSLGDVSVYMSSPIATCSNKTQEKPCRNSDGKNANKRIVLEANDKLVVSKLGSAAIKGCLELSKAHLLYEDLQKAQESLVLIDCLHLLYLVTPYNSLENIKVDKNQLHNIMIKLGSRERKTAAVLGITDSCIMLLYSNQNIKSVNERVLNKFYTSLMLYDLWNEIPVVDVSEKYRVNRGVVQNLMTNAAAFASNVVSFCEELEEFWAFAHLLKGMSQRLAHCCCRELQPLMELPAVKQSRARQLYNAGFKDLQSIAKANPNDLVQAIEFMTRRLANQLIAAAKLLLLEKVETLREEAEDVLDGIDHPKLLFNQSISL